ncbi:hypothetical protein TCAL_07025 [Tigriopus californicus]|uniref:Uncharacterized protein n=1 Tax=Tigriopus californicus TaxID=6832 RepID=A0A553PDL5_TIGCA|nr:tetratricopeptide repeat protein 36-like [Tigriopus californicus]TRY75778.1 hypothetical protein TCAL_07025 [Tigriopus californicus]
MSNPHDRIILNSVVNPLLPLGEGVYDDEHEIPETLKDNEEDNPKTRESKALEQKAIAACDAGCYPKALELLAQALDVAPERAAIYNNRAQVYRLMNQDLEAKMDLNRAIDLSQGRGRSACQAFCQRGLLWRKEGNDPEAMADFRRSAELGSEFAKSLLVQLNPYAAMCNKMLKNVFQALESGSNEVENPFPSIPDPSGTKQG